MERIYLDYAASTPLHEEVFLKMKPYILGYKGNPSSSHAEGRELRAAIETARRTIASIIGATASEIIFTSGGTEADNMAIINAVETHHINHIITSKTEHHAVLHTVEKLEKKQKVEVSYVDVDTEGMIILDSLEAHLQKNPQALVALMHANNELGCLLDLEEAGNLCEKYGALFLSDTVQTMGKVPFNLSNTPVHFITASAHKFYGPKGIGFLYIKKGVKASPFIHGGSQERNLRAGTENVASIVGMAYALELSYQHLEQKLTYIADLKNYMLNQLKAFFPDIEVNGPTNNSNVLPTILNISFPKDEDLMLLFHLDLHGISVSGGSACSSGAAAGSHVLSCLGKEPNKINNALRFSFSDTTTKAEIDHVIIKLKEILKLSVAV